MNDFSSIWLSLDVHRDKVNAVVDEYRKADKRNRKTYSDDFYQRQHEELIAKYREKIAKEKENVGNTLNVYFGNIQDTLNQWVSAPLPESKTNLLYLIMQSGLKLNRAEFEAIQESIGTNYWGNRILARVAEQNSILVKKGYGLETYERILKDCISSADVFVNGFYGQNPAWEFVPENVSKHLVAAAAAGTPIKNGCALHRAALLWDGSSIPCSKTKLSVNDKDIIEKLYSGCSTDNEKISRTEELISETPELVDILKLTEYGRFVSEK